jgi:hypothetical protein
MGRIEQFVNTRYLRVIFAAVRLNQSPWTHAGVAKTSCGLIYSAIGFSPALVAGSEFELNRDIFLQVAEGYAY